MNVVIWAVAVLLGILMSEPSVQAVDANPDKPGSPKLRVAFSSIGQFNPRALEPYFAKYKACFMLSEGEAGPAFAYHAEECEQRKVPCSTFKIPNSIIGLDTGVLTDENHLFKWDGTKQFISDWERDHTLQSAVQYSVVWYFKKVAAAVGAERMREYLKNFDYGNQDMSAGLTQFWLGSPAHGGSLKISAKEQIDFLKKLYFERLPVKKRSMQIAKRIIVLKQTPYGTLSGKTGSSYKDGKWVLGWFVGYLVHDKKPYFFAANIEAEDGASGPRAREIVEEILKDAQLL